MSAEAIGAHPERALGGVGPLSVPWLGGFAVLVAASVWGGIELTRLTGPIAAIWIANAVIVIAALKVPRSRLPLLLAVALVATLAGDLATGDSLADAVVLALINFVEVGAVVFPLRRFRLHRDLGDGHALAAFYGLSLLVAPVISALLAGTYFHYTHGVGFAVTARGWYLGDALGLATLVPPFATARPRDFAAMFGRDERRGTLLLLLGFAGIVALGYAVRQYPLGFLFLPLVLLMTFVRGFAGGTFGLMLAAGYLLSEIFLHSVGGALATHSLHDQVVIVEIFAAVMSFTVVVCGAALEHRRRLEAAMSAALAHAEAVREEAFAARNAAETANRTKSMFLANMSHELRTPLNAVLGFSELMQGEMFGPLGHPRYKEYASTIHDAGAHLLELINDILDMSKIEAGKFEIDRERLDLTQVVRECLALMKPRADEAVLTLAAEMPAGPVWLLADRRALKQILLNLLSNAVKFTPAGGMVTVRAAIRPRSSGSAVVLAVADTGVGIPAKAIERLGNPFVQLRSGADHTHKGTGLGLALVRALAGMHHGTMRIESQEGRGTTVSVEIPMAEAAAAAA